MTPDQIRIEARIYFLRTDEGGRSTALAGEGSYRPNHNFFGPDDRDMCVGFIALSTGEVIRPGDTVTKEIRLLTGGDLLPEIHEGRQWRIQEGLKLVALGTVLRVGD
jgi:elongation factor Tu